jgi:hypothetical protein
LAPNVTLYAPDFVGLGGLLVHCLIVAFFFKHIDNPLLIYESVVACVACLLAFRAAQAWLGEDHRIHRTGDWWVCLAFLAIYLNMNAIADGAAVPLADGWLSAIDQRMFGLQPAVWLSQHHHAYLTEILFLAYASYYGWVAFTGIALGRGERRPFHAYLSAIGITAFVQLAGYIFVPAIGPRFTEAAEMAVPLHGVWLADGLERSFRHAFYLRDCFPSGHTLQTLVAMWFAAAYLSRRQAALVSVAGIAIIAATLYCRMHYAIDLLAAVPLAAGGIAFGEWWSVRRQPLTLTALQKYPLTKLWRY